MFLAALWSRGHSGPHSGQECPRTERPVATKTPQPEQAWLVNAGLIATTSPRPDRPTGACCLVGEDAQERRPASVSTSRGAVVMLDQGADLQLLVIPHIVAPHQGQGGRIVTGTPLLAAHRLLRLRQQGQRRASGVAA